MRCILFLLTALVSTLSAKPVHLKVKVSAPSALLMDAKTGEVLYEKEAYRRMFPSSITKIATVHYVIEKLGEARLDEVVTASGDDLVMVPANVRSDPNCPSYRLDPRGTRMWLMAGETASIRTLLHGAMLPSGNDACNVLARHCSGSIEQFMEELNQFIKQFGIKETQFMNPHGLHDDAHYTTAYDMACIGRAAMRNPLFRSIVKKDSYPRPKTNLQPQSLMEQHNLLVRKGAYYYEKATGIKTGGAYLSKNTLVASAEEGDRSLIAVFLGCNERRQNFRDAVKLFEEAFKEEKVSRTFFAKGCDFFSKEVEGGKSEVRGGLLQDLTLSYYPSQEPEVKAFLQWDVLEMPVREGDVIGQMQLLSAGNQVITSVPLFAVADVEPTFWHQLKSWIQHYRVWLTVALMLLVIGVSVVTIHEKRGPRIGR